MSINFILPFWDFGFCVDNLTLSLVFFHHEDPSAATTQAKLGISRAKAQRPQSKNTHHEGHEGFGYLIILNFVPSVLVSLKVFASCANFLVVSL